jgi:putative NIF3 family GTP cyclohydrolase 1 type 2
VKLSEIYKLADEIAPKALSDEYCRVYGAYDNSGLLVEAGEEIQGILFSLDLTNAAIDEAIEKGCNLIITHHPAIYGKIGNVCQNDDSCLAVSWLSVFKMEFP